MAALHTAGYMMKNKLFIRVLAVLAFLVRGASNEDPVSVMEGDSVTLHTGVQRNQKDRQTVKWYFEGVLITEITGDKSKICTDEECKEVTERFRDRLKVDNQTGSLTIMNIRTTDSGDYQLTSSGAGKKNFPVKVHAAERDEVKNKSAMEGESVTLDPGVMKDTNDVMKWYFNDTLIAEITGDQSQIWTDVKCVERFRDRLKLDHQTGSLTITNIRTTDSGLYHLQINSHIHHGHYSIISTSVKISSVTVTSSGLSGAAIAGMVGGVLLVFVAVAGGVIYYRHRTSKSINDVETNEQELLKEDRE